MESGKKVLIIDDDSRNIYALRLVLRTRGIECLDVSNATLGLKLLEEENDVSVVLMDMMMPGVDGYEAMEIIRNTPGLEDLCIIAVTAQAMIGDREKCLAAGASAYVSKPIDIDVLLELLNEQISGEK
ncbi:CheY chemotaxis protein or a CheY-like REC (receiver) domain [Chitinophaga sp. CF118]|uniref:response regulator n=1 Tax=Chitinophaga sp. CF118 TaxID=1884367 RepID=UPI0008DFBB68|nr:response regulator [Chitinophaga sp. CF118]SFD56298.1 CheY chemotaxis protein or a CheY-like REC (receiver) domain [Chitinophaga sp. CF118]